jgi:L-malate glycosyltransferase
MNRRRAVLHVLHAAVIGGGEKLVLDLVSCQKSDPDLDVAVLFLQSASGDLAGAFRALGVPLHELHLDSGRDFSPAKLLKAISLLRRFDILHVHHFGVQLAAAAVATRIKVVFTVHGILAQGRALRLADRVNIVLLGWFLNHHVDLITYNSLHSRRIAQQRYGLKGVAGEVIYNGIVMEEDRPGAAMDPVTAASVAGQFVVGVVARFAEVKRIERLIDGFAIFARRHANVRLMLVGDGTLRPQLEERASAAGIAERTIFTGFRVDVRPYQRAMDVCVMPSINETFGLAAVESLAMGKPVIVFPDGGGLVEIVGSCTPADIVRTVDELAGRLDYYASNPEALASNATARSEYAARFNITSTAEAFRRQYLAMTKGVA